jgi:phage-related protein
MAGSPGGIEVGRVSLKVLPDTTDFVPKLETFVKKVEHQLKVDIPVNLDFTQAHQELKDELRVMQGYAYLHPVDVDMEVNTVGAMDHLDLTLAAMQGTADLNPVNVDIDIDGAARAAAEKQLIEFGSSGGESMGRIGQQIALWGPLIFIAAAGIAGLAPALAVIFPLVAGIGAGIAVIGLGMKQLHKVFQPIIDGFKKMRVAIGNALTAGLAPIIQSMTTKFMPAIKAALVGFAGFVNGALKQLLRFLNGSNGLTLMAQLFAGLGPALQPFARLLPLVLSIFLRLSVAALPALKIMGDALVSVATQFDNLLKSGSATGVITTAMNQLGQVFLILGRLGAAILPTLISALPVIIDLLTGLGHGFGTVIGFAKPLFDFLAKHSTTVQAFGSALGVMAVILGVAAGAFFVLNAVMDANPIVLVVAAVAALVIGMKYAYDNSAKFRKIVDATGKALVAAWGNVKSFLTPIFAWLGKAFVQVGHAVVFLLAPVIALVGFIVKNFGTIKSVVGAVVGFIVDHFKLFALTVGLPITAIILLVGFIVKNFGTIKAVVGPVISFIVDHMSLLAKVFGLIIAPLQILVSLIVTNFGTIKTVIVTVFNGIVAFLGVVWTVIKTIFMVGLNLLLAPVRTTIALIVGAFHLLQGIVGIVTAAFGAAKAAVGPAISGIVAVVRGAINGVLAAVRVVSGVVGILRSAFNSAKSAVSSAINGIVTTAKGLVTKIKSALTFDLSGAGKAIMNSFAAGIKAAGQKAIDIAKGIANKIKGLVPGSPIKWGPLTSFNNGTPGKLLMGMFADGLQIGGVKVISQAESIVAQMQDTFASFTPGDLGAGFTAAADLSGVKTNFSSQVGAIVDNTTNPDDFVQQVQINWDTGRGAMKKISAAEAARQEFIAAANNRLGVPE